MKILKSIQLLTLVMLILGCAREDDQVYVEPVEELSSTKASACRSSLIFNYAPITRSLPYTGGSGLYDSAFVFDGQMYAGSAISCGDLESESDPWDVYIECYDWWRSSDGIEWSKVRLPKSLSHKRVKLVAFKNQLWCLEQRSSGRRVWKFTNGLKGFEMPSWQLITNVGRHPFLSDVGYDSNYIVSNDKIWVIKDFIDYTQLLSSTDMINWDKKDVNSSGANLENHNITFTFFDGKIWRIGADRRGNPKESAYSSDGISWTVLTKEKKWDLSHHTTLVYDDKLYIIGGENSSGNVNRDIWVSKDGLKWSEVTRYNTAPFSQRSRHLAVAFKDKLWIIGGYGYALGSHREVWNMRKCSNITIGPTKGK